MSDMPIHGQANKKAACGALKAPVAPPTSGNGGRHRRDVDVVIGRRRLHESAHRLGMLGACERGESAPPDYEQPPQEHAFGGHQARRWGRRKTHTCRMDVPSVVRKAFHTKRGSKVMAIGVVHVVVGVLVMREQVLRDPDEDVEANWVRGELEPVVDPRVVG
eukprot:scaffold59691_cov31-Tisochrysis_lutea.AAC.3